MMYIVDPYYYSNGIFINMLTDFRVSCFSFSVGSINDPTSIDSGSEGSPDRETSRKKVAAKLYLFLLRITLFFISTKLLNERII